MGDAINSSEDDKPKKTQGSENFNPHSSPSIFISSSFELQSSILSTRVNYLTPFSTSFNETSILEDVSSTQLLNKHFRNFFLDSSSSHLNALSTPYVVDIPTSYLLNSSYLLDSYYFLENSLNLFEDSSSPVSGSHMTSSYEGTIFQSFYDSKGFVESDQTKIPISESITPTPSAENIILIMTPSHALLEPIKEFVSSDKSSSFNIPTIKSSKSQFFENVDNFPEYVNGNANLEKNENAVEITATKFLSEIRVADLDHFVLETGIISIENDFAVQSTSLSPLSADIGSASDNEFHFFMENSKSALGKEYPHEIISDSSSTDNKTYRNEDAEVNQIISSIIHFLAGNVQVVRPNSNGFGAIPTRLHLPPHPPLVSTRINNRGPIIPNGLSRTVVLFSQPQHNGHPATELSLPGHLFPSAIPKAPFIRIRPSQVLEALPPGVSLIHYYKQRPNQRVPPKPFRGEVFHSSRPSNTQVRVTTLPDEFLVPSLMNHEKLHIFNDNIANKYPHFIFSDDAASSVVLLFPSNPTKVQAFQNIPPETVKLDNIGNKNSPVNNFEVLIDDSLKEKNTVRDIETPMLKLSDNFKVHKETTFNARHTEASISKTKTREEAIPYGPITAWVPFYEHPSIKVKYNATHLSDTNVSIVLDPVIFDLTVNDSSNEMHITENPTKIHSSIYGNSSSYFSETSIIESSEITPIPETITALSTETSILLSSSNVLDLSVSRNSPLVPQSISISTTDLREIELSRFHISHSKTAISSSTRNVDITRISGQRGDSSITIAPILHSSNTTTSTVTISTLHSSTVAIHTVHSSYSHGIGNFFTEKRAFVENSENVDLKSNNSSHTPQFDQSSEKLEITPSSSQINDKTLLGRPIVIPVDIEEVRPFVGPINPSNPDRNRNNPYQGSVPAQQKNTVEITERKTTPSTTTRTPIIRSQTRPKPNTVRIDTCIVGDDSTCNANLNETCKTEFGISSCHCRPGHARSSTRGPCIPIVSLIMSMKIDRFGTKKVLFSPKYFDKNSEEYRVMEFEAKVALSSLISQIPAFSRTFLGLRVNTFYPINEKLVMNTTLYLEDKESTRTQAIRIRLRQLISEAIRNNKQNIGDSHLYVDESPITAIEDLNECSDSSLNDCSEDGMCFNVFGTFLCKCRPGYVDLFAQEERKSGRKCSACSPEYCSFHGKCFVEQGKRFCKCHGNYIGSRCEIDGEVLGVALGASLAAIIIILLTLGCLCIWNRKWKQQQQKAEVLSSRSCNSHQTFSYVGNMMNANTNPYNLTMEDRMRWAQISDVIKNISVQPNPELPYLPATLDQGQFPGRCKDDEISWYECRTRPRSRTAGQYRGMAGPSCFEMDASNRSYHSSKRNKHSPMRY